MSGESETLVCRDYVLDYLKQLQAENPGFFYAIQGDYTQSAVNVFWANAFSRSNYDYFGDTVRFDRLYRSKELRVPLATFTGLNHHAQPVLFGCALIFDECGSTFLWLFQTWLEAMGGKCPVSITTDLDQHIEMAVANVLPKARHRVCKTSVFKETQEKLAGIYHMHPTFAIEFKKCINETDTVEEFESQWSVLVERYRLASNEWLQTLYNARHQWVSVFLRDSFFGELLTSDVSDSLSSFFDGFVSSSTTIELLFKHCERAITSWHEKELHADSDTIDNVPILKTPSPMEKQAANLYTRIIFIKFQGELVETHANLATTVEDSGTSTTYRVSKFGEEQKAQIVTFYACEMKANCSCRMFEFCGIVCRHILSVFQAKNALTLPSHYVLKRWTRDAKNSIEGIMNMRDSESTQDSQESLTARYNNLLSQALKFVEEGAKSIHKYNVAMNGLQEASEKVSAAKKRKSESINGTDKHTVNSQEIGSLTDSHAANTVSLGEKKKRIQQLTAELQSTNQRCEVYRANLMTILKDAEDQKLKLSIKVQNARLSLKE